MAVQTEPISRIPKGRLLYHCVYNPLFLVAVTDEAATIEPTLSAQFSAQTGKSASFLQPQTLLSSPVLSLNVQPYIF